MISEEAFKQRYGDIYNRLLAEARKYASSPAQLRRDIELKEKAVLRSKLRAPYPDPFPYRMMRYEGFVRYPERLKNFIIAENEPRSVVRSFLPTIMDIEPNSRCMCRCIMCQVSGWKDGKRADDMTLDAFKGFIDNEPQLSEVKLHGMGDPFLNKDFIEMIRYLVSRYIWVRTSTNALLLHIDENYKRLIDSGIGEVQVSFDGATKEVYEKIRRGANFETVVKNSTMLNDYANRKERLYTRMWVLVQEGNRHQIFEFVEMAKKMGFRRVTFSITLNDWGQKDWGVKNKDLGAREGLIEEERHNLLEMAEREGLDITVWEQADKYSTKNPDTLCPWPFARPYIASDMRIVPCCMIANPDTVDLGDAREFNELWNASVYQEFRRNHLEGKIPDYCRNCYK